MSWTADSGQYIPMENATLQWIVRTQASQPTDIWQEAKVTTNTA